MDRNYLKGKVGDKINALLAGSGFNIRKLLRAFLFPILEWLFAMDIDWNRRSRLFSTMSMAVKT
jgi:IS5 family transposase